jgi:hypothetical protein
VASARLSGATHDAGGTVTYTVYSDPSCTTAVRGAGTAPVMDGFVFNSAPVIFSVAGTFYWQAVYSGDDANNGASSACTSLTVLASPFARLLPR